MGTFWAKIYVENRPLLVQNLVCGKIRSELTEELQMSNPQLGLRLCRWVWVLLGQFWGRNLKRILDLGCVVARRSLLFLIRRCLRHLVGKGRRKVGMIGGKRIASYDEASDDARPGYEIRRWLGGMLRHKRPQAHADQGDAFGVFATFKATSRLLCCFR